VPPPSKFKRDQQEKADLTLKVMSCGRENGSINGELDPRLIYSDNPQQFYPPVDPCGSNNASELQKFGATQLGESAIKNLDLADLVQQVFDQEYDSASITKRVQARQTRHTFDYEAENLGVSTDLSCRIFQILSTFVASERKKVSHDSTPVQMTKHGVLTPKPTVEARARLIDAIHAVEDLFVNYASDIIGRVVKDFQAQQDFTSSQGSAAQHLKRSRSPRLFQVKYEFAISTSLLLNDIQAYADSYSKFRQHNSQYFDLTEEEEQQRSKFAPRLDCQLDLGKSSSESESDESDLIAQVPVDLELSKCFTCLQIIDEFRFKNEP